MKTLLIVLTLGAMFAACSSPKYTYYFDRYSTKSNAKAKDVFSEKSSVLTSGVINSNSSIPIQAGTLVASTSKEILVQPNKMIAVDNKDVGDEWVIQWTTESYFYKTGKSETVNLNESYRLVNGKVREISQYARVVPATK